MPFKLHADHRRHIPRQKHRVTNWPAYEAGLRQRGSLTVWFTDAAIAAWRADPRSTPGGQRRYSGLAITTALTLRSVFGLALRQTEGLIGSIIGLLDLDIAVPDHTTLSRRAEGLELPRLASGDQPVHLLVDSTGLRLCGPGEWLVEKHGSQVRRAWRKLHLGTDADTGEIVAVALTPCDSDDGLQVPALLDQIERPIASFTADGAYDQDGVYKSVAKRNPDAPVVVPPRSLAVLSNKVHKAPTQRDRHLQQITKHGRMEWQKATGYQTRALVEADISRFKRVIGSSLRSHKDPRRLTEVRIAAGALNRMLQPELCPRRLIVGSQRSSRPIRSVHQSDASSPRRDPDRFTLAEPGQRSPVGWSGVRRSSRTPPLSGRAPP